MPTATLPMVCILHLVHTTFAGMAAYDVIMQRQLLQKRFLAWVVSSILTMELIAAIIILLILINYYPGYAYESISSSNLACAGF